MSKLTKDIRSNMLEEIIEKSFDGKLEDMKSRSEKLAREIYLANIPADELKLLNSLPDGIAPVTGHVMFKMFKKDGLGNPHKHEVIISSLRSYDQFSSSVSSSHFSFNEPIRVPFVEFQRTSDRNNVDVEDPKVVALLGIEREKIALYKQREDLRRKICAILNSVNTFKKLWEVWPESKELVGHLEESSEKTFLPSLDIAQVNAALGIPKEKAEV